jgi:hypothetical protein
VQAVQDWSNGRCRLFEIGVMEGVGCSGLESWRRLFKIGVMECVGFSGLE